MAHQCTRHPRWVRPERRAPPVGDATQCGCGHAVWPGLVCGPAGGTRHTCTRSAHSREPRLLAAPTWGRAHTGPASAWRPPPPSCTPHVHADAKTDVLLFLPAQFTHVSGCELRWPLTTSCAPPAGGSGGPESSSQQAGRGGGGQLRQRAGRVSRAVGAVQSPTEPVDCTGA